MTELDVPVLVYPSKGAEKVFDRRDRGCLERHLQGLADLHNGLITPDAEYLLAIMWEDRKDERDCPDRMTDLWMYNIKGWSPEFGPLVDVRIFRGLEPETAKGVAAGNSLVVLGREEEHRVAKGNLNNYLYGERPELPERLMLNEDFYLE